MARAEEIDFFDPRILSDPFDFYCKAHREHPIVKLPGADTYVVFSRAHIEDALRRVEDFSSNFGHILVGSRYHDPEIVAVMRDGYPFADTLLTADPPTHTHFRKLVNLAFNKPRVNAMADYIRSIVVRLIGDFVDDGHCDFSKQFAMQLPVEVISGQIGLGHLPKSTVKGWAEAITDRLGGLIDRDRELQCAREVVTFQRTVIDLIGRYRRGEGEDNLLRGLVDARIEGERPLDDVELLSVVQQLMAAGTQSTSAMLSTGLLLLIRNPIEMQRLRADVTRVPIVVEEMLRLEPPSQGLWRIAKHDTQLGEVAIPGGARVMLRIGAANRDPAAFGHPEQFNSERKNPYNHLSFGKGIHTCIGNLLARKELAIAYEEILRRLDDIELDSDEKLEYTPIMHVRGLAHLKIRFKPIRAAQDERRGSGYE